MNEELEKIAQDLRKKERELWAGNPPRMGNGAVALMLDGYASRPAPPRNCDRFDCAEEAWVHYCNEVGQASDRSWKSLILFGKWLFAPAEGGKE